MKKNGMVAVVTIAVFACLLLCTPALADYNFDGFPVETRASGTVNGGVFIDYVPGAEDTQTGSFEVPSGNIKWAYLYTGIWGGTENYEGWVNVTFNEDCTTNNLGPIWLRGKKDTNPNVWCTGHGKHWMYYNVTNLTNAWFKNSANVSKINATDPGEQFDGDPYGIVLVVVYEGGDNPKDLRYWINDGSDGLNYITPHDAGTTYFNGAVDTNNVTNANLTMVHLTAYDPSVSNGLKFNGNTLDTSMINTNAFDLHSWDVTNYLESSGNDAWYTRCGDYSTCSIPLSDGYINICNAILVLEREAVEKPDLIVESITPNCGGYLFGNESNGICAKITNNGADVNASNASFVLSGGYSEIVEVHALAAGANTTVCVTDPTLRNAGDSVTITVTADCNGEINESHETNNVTVQPETVVNNGYKGKRYTGGEDINTWKTFELQGDLLYSVGDSYYLSASSTGQPHWTTYNASWTASDLPVPGTASVKEARLYVPYTWDKKGVMPTYVSMSFNENLQTLDAHYSDEKMHATSYSYGMLAYNVTADFNTRGNVANLTNTYPGGGNVSMRGMLLAVIYADDSEPPRKIYINEEFDMLYGGSSKCTTPAEATAYAPFGAIAPSSVNSTTLITVAPGAGPNEGDLSFNGQIIGTDVWNYGGTSQIGINETDVTSYLNATDNEADLQSSGDWMEASNAILVITYKEAAVPIFDTGSPANPYPSIFGTHNGTITPNYDIPVSRMYAYPCAGTGGHSEYIEIWNATGWTVNASWNGYKDDWHIISFDEPFILEAGKTYNYTIITGSYPQIYHRAELEAVGGTGTIRCTKFVDANGKEYNNWIPAIKLY